MSLKEHTKDLHDLAEQTQFAQHLLSGNIDTALYANYLYQMALVYGPIELGNKSQGYLQQLPGIERANAIYEDFIELAGKSHGYQWLPSTTKYYNYILALLSDPDRVHLIQAHMYCRHMGDLYGGQIVSSRVPGSGKFYKFENAAHLREQIRKQLTDDYSDEARVAFQFTIDIMRELCDE